jgi:hypothetical protein
MKGLTDEDYVIRQRVYNRIMQGFTPTETAQMVGCSRALAYKICDQMGLPKNGPLTKKRQKNLLTLAANGYTIEEISQMVDWAPCKVREYLTGYEPDPDDSD